MPSGLTDALWLAAHDGVEGRPCVGERPLAVGLAAGLLAELVHGGLLELRQGELFRTSNMLPTDPALAQVVATMVTEERGWPQPVPLVPSRQGRPLPVREDTRHRRRGHELGRWLSYLAGGQRAEKLVIDRLEGAGLVKRVQQRRLFRGPTLRYVPCNSVVAGRPANRITSAVQRGYRLSVSELVLAGLFLATGLHHHALATLEPVERSLLERQVEQGLDPMSRELVKAVDAAVGDAAMR